jgi:multidrug efflux pump subunit AcrB
MLVRVFGSVTLSSWGSPLPRGLFREQASLYAYVGMFMLMGIVKKNGIMIVDLASQDVTGRQGYGSTYPAMPSHW